MVLKFTLVIKGINKYFYIPVYHLTQPRIGQKSVSKINLYVVVGFSNKRYVVVGISK